MIRERILGPHLNRFTQEGKQVLRDRRPRVVKLLESASDALEAAELAGLWAEVDLLLRHTFTSEQPELGRVDTALRRFARALRLGAKRAILEVPINEGMQTGEALLRYLDFTVQAAERIFRAGFTPAIGNFSTGNPPTLPGDVLAFEQAISECRKYGAVLSLHEYWLADHQLDTWNPLRYRKFIELLRPENRLDLYITESGLDRIWNSSTRGWRTYSPNEPPSKAVWYRRQIEAYLREVAKDPYVRGVLLYCLGQFGEWADFDIEGEPTLYELFSLAFDRPELPQPVATPVPGLPPAPPPEPELQPLFWTRTPAIPWIDPDQPTPLPVPEVTVPMHKRAYIHQFDQLGEKSVPEIAATLRLADIREVACKTHQELTWINKFDKSPLSFGSLADVKARFREFAAEGIRLVPWCVPMGTNLNAEIERAGEVALSCDGVIELDTEPYREFWTGPFNLLLPYAHGIKVGGARFEVNFDARPGGWHPFTSAQFSQVCAEAEAVSTQTYWRWFQSQGDTRPTASIVQDALSTLVALGVPMDKVRVIYGYEAPDEFAAVTLQLQGAGVQSIGLWKLGEAGMPVFQALAAIPTEARVEPAQTPVLGFDTSVLSPYLDRMWAKTGELAAIEHQARAEQFQRDISDLKKAVGLS